MKRLNILVSISLALIFTAKADGGPIVDPLLFAKLKEGQRVAVNRYLLASEVRQRLYH